ncbi:hypothetical protein FCM35_KLT05846 [Carex littledalei]|uniref:Uncharacterized protein n=1 Tax=Carex littledalei TaxID=544730 RepID=A0A833VMR3_9POAL|nr:hypothetical protein FCM35_KLT05846 [Carex littledalei]
MVVLIGVAVCTVTDVSVNAMGLIAAVTAVWSICLQQYLKARSGKKNCMYILFQKYSLDSFNLLGDMALVQAASLVLTDPFVDLWLTGKRIDKYNYALPS